MSMLNTAGGGQPPAGGGPVTSTRKSGQAQGTGTVTGSNGRLTALGRAGVPTAAHPRAPARARV